MKHRAHRSEKAQFTIYIVSNRIYIVQCMSALKVDTYYALSANKFVTNRKSIMVGVPSDICKIDIKLC